ncbi:co-chaperone DjlA [Modicisalibacter sp. 'Wilcox']|uniref:co-chaperone DjlA n=1 Tax=Modicisalibacter sp. 'Wilcox' TaxID=2679914 RepID=UPI0013D41ABA|nr:co-chaperone DjlA [Modicisalibacter sp. 'Wilcox']
MLTLILIGALLGLWIGGPLGLLIGGGIGYWIARRWRRSALGRLAGARAQFLESTFAVMGCLCKADGRVSEDELEASRRIWDQLRLDESQRARARADFNRGKAADFDLDAELARLRPIVGQQSALRQVFLQIQLAAIAADGRLDPAEHEMLVRVARGLGCNESEVAQIEALLRGATAGDTGPGGAPSAQALEDAYRVLGVDSRASDTEIKRAYRKLMSENHPDKLAAKGLPESMREMAEKRTREITHAYDLIKQARAEAA